MLTTLLFFTSLSVVIAQLSLDASLIHGLLPLEIPELSQVQAPAGPFIAPSWSASIVEYSSIGTGKGTMFYDIPREQWRLKTCSLQTIFHPDDELCTDQLAKNRFGPTGFNINMTAGRGSDSVCKAFPGPFYDILFLSQMSLATHEGNKMVGGEPCEIWQMALKSAAYAINISSCIASDGVPREHNFSSNTAYKAASASNYVFSNVSIGLPSDDAFAGSDACEHRYPMQPCPSHGVEDLDVYRVRSLKEPNVLSNRDVGDALGDMAFFCGLGGMDETQVVTRWSVQANSSWGQYAYCLYTGGKNTCFGNSGKNVGRQSAEGLGRGSVQGQCSKNDDVGTWLSFPAEGLCAEGAQIGHEGCTWIARPLRTVSAACILNERGLKASCAEERGHAPMTKSAAIFKAALESGDPTQGGCPDVTMARKHELLLV